MDPQEPQESKKPEQSAGTFPLKAEPPKVARFSRRMFYGLAAAVCVITTFSLLTGLSPKEKAQGEETATKATEKNQCAPVPPDPLATAPGKYSDLNKTGHSSNASRHSSASGEPGAVPGEPQPQPQDPRPYPMQSAAGSQTPQEQVKAREREQTIKDAASAVNSPVTFNENEQQIRGEEQPKGDGAVPPLLPELLKMADRVPGSAGQATDDQNLQGEKRDFSRERSADYPYLKATLLAPLSQYEIKAGTLLPATLITGINSDLPGQLVAQMRENVYDTVTGNYLLIPQGTRLIGAYDSKIAFGQERVLVVWTRLIMPNGLSIALEGMPGADLSGYAGVTGKVNNHYGKLVTGVVLGSVIGAGAQVAVGGQGAPNVPPSFGQQAVSGAAQNINQSAQQHTSKVLNMQPTIEVAPGDKINVFVTRDMILQPFTE